MPTATLLARFYPGKTTVWLPLKAVFGAAVQDTKQRNIVPLPEGRDHSAVRQSVIGALRS